MKINGQASGAEMHQRIGLEIPILKLRRTLKELQAANKIQLAIEN